MKNFLLIFQNILKLFVIFLISFIWTKYFIKTLWICLLVSIFITFLIYFSIRYFQRKKYNKNNLKIKEKDDAENMFLSLATSKNSIDFYFKLAKSKYPSVEKKKEYILINHSEKVQTALVPFLKFTEMSVDNLTNIILMLNDPKIKKVVICTYAATLDAQAFTKNFDKTVVILDKFDTYALLYKAYGIFPEVSMEYKKDKKLVFRDIISYAFNPSRAKGYIISALFLFLSSFIIAANLYYCIFASILLVFALLSYSQPFKPASLNEEVI